MGGAQDEVGTRSGAFWLFHDKIHALRQQDRAPKPVVLENVPGVLTSHAGRDFCAIVAPLSDLGFLTGAFVLDARFFTPQPRPRVFFIAVCQNEKDFAEGFAGAAPETV